MFLQDTDELEGPANGWSHITCSQTRGMSEPKGSHDTELTPARVTDTKAICTFHERELTRDPLSLGRQSLG